MGSPVAVYFLLFFALFCSFLHPTSSGPFLHSFCCSSLTHLPAIPCHVSAHVYSMCMLRCVASIDLTARSDRQLPHGLSPSSHPAMQVVGQQPSTRVSPPQPAGHTPYCIWHMALSSYLHALQPVSSQQAASKQPYTYIHKYIHTYIRHTYMHTYMIASFICQSRKHVISHI
jgi:hypothetical protein